MVYSLGRLLEIIGEVATQVSEELRDSVPAIPWPLIIGVSNTLKNLWFLSEKFWVSVQ